MAAATICSDLGVQENKVSHCFHCFPIYLPWTVLGPYWFSRWVLNSAVSWWETRPASSTAVGPDSPLWVSLLFTCETFRLALRTVLRMFLEIFPCADQPPCRCLACWEAIGSTTVSPAREMWATWQIINEAEFKGAHPGWSPSLPVARVHSSPLGLFCH